MRYLSSVEYGLVALLLLIWLPACELIRRTVPPWRHRWKHERETGEKRQLTVQVGPFKIIDRPFTEDDATQ